MSYFTNPVFGVDNAGAFRGMGDSLASNPLGEQVSMLEALQDQLLVMEAGLA